MGNRSIVTTFLASEESTSTTEYAFMLAFITLVAAAVIYGTGEGVKNSFATLSKEVKKTGPY